MKGDHGDALRGIHFLGRVATLAATSVAPLDDGTVGELICELDANTDQIASQRDAVSAALFEAVGGAATNDRRVLLMVRRALFGCRPVTAAEIDALRTPLGNAFDLVARHNALLVSRADLLHRLETNYATRLVEDRRQLQRAAAAPEFERALLLASRALHSNLRRYLALDAANLGARDGQIERGVLKYASRAALKATPFASFCATALGEFSQDAHTGHVVRIVGMDKGYFSTVRLNRRIYRALWNQLRTCNAVRHMLRVEQNDTLRRVGDSWRFWCAEATGTGFKDIPSQPVTDSILEKAAGKPARYGDLRAAMSAEERDELDSLIAAGALRLHNPVPEQCADWPSAVEDFLSSVQTPVAASARGLTQRLAQERDRYAAAKNASDRIASLDAMHAALQSAAQAMGDEVMCDTPVFEDAGTPARVVVTVTPGVISALDAAREWIRVAREVSEWHDRGARMRSLFEQHSKGRQRISLGEFHELAESQDEGMVAAEITTRRDAGWHRVAECFWRRWSEDPRAEEVNVSANEIRDALDGAGIPRAAPGSSTLFAQLVGRANDDPSVRIVAAKDHYPIGYGKFFARFLSLVSNEVRETLLNDNRALEGPNVFAELCADAFVNVNLHEPLLDAEISVPSADADGIEARIHVSELVLERDPADEYSLALIHSGSGRRVVPVDLGFLTLRTRSSFYRTLAALGPSGDAYAPIPDLLAHPDPGCAPGIEYRPRLVYAGRVVVARRRWRIPASCTPPRVSSDSEWKYLARVVRWARDTGLPMRVYCVGPSRDWHKPQYIDFTSPLFVRMFARLVESLEEGMLEIQEALPDLALLPHTDDAAHAVELVIQFNDRSHDQQSVPTAHPFNPEP